MKYIQEDSFSCSVLELVLDRLSIHITLFNLNFKLESGELSHLTLISKDVLRVLLETHNQNGEMDLKSLELWNFCKKTRTNLSVLSCS